MSSDPKFEIVRPTGILDGTQAQKFRKTVRECLDSNPEIILVNLQDVTFIDSSGLGGLVSALKMVRTAGAKMSICSINDQVRMLFELTSMDRVFKVYPDEETFKQKVVDAS
jgi:anti-anti-sigma factor